MDIWVVCHSQRTDMVVCRSGSSLSDTTRSKNHLKVTLNSFLLQISPEPIICIRIGQICTHSPLICLLYYVPCMLRYVVMHGALFGVSVPRTTRSTRVLSARSDFSHAGCFFLMSFALFPHSKKIIQVWLWNRQQEELQWSCSVFPAFKMLGLLKITSNVHAVNNVFTYLLMFDQSSKPLSQNKYMRNIDLIKVPFPFLKCMFCIFAECPIKSLTEVSSYLARNVRCQSYLTWFKSLFSCTSRLNTHSQKACKHSKSLNNEKKALHTQCSISRRITHLIQSIEM